MTNKEPIGHGRITEHGTGLGTVTPEMVQRRAREIALSDGRAGNEVTSADWEQARRELLGAGNDPAAETDTEEAGSTAGWDPAPPTIGRRAETQEVDDEQTTAEQLYQEGVEEADHDERVQSGRETRRQQEE
ncbi:MAG TPA: DUF2934 domain-containing protein [Verrucomicrobiae bacterium]|nr:DUF2934 domain-containing protein [Verrucomicrobiae bacterium]